MGRTFLVGHCRKSLLQMQILAGSVLSCDRHMSQDEHEGLFTSRIGLPAFEIARAFVVVKLRILEGPLQIRLRIRESGIACNHEASARRDKPPPVSPRRPKGDGISIGAKAPVGGGCIWSASRQRPQEIAVR